MISPIASPEGRRIAAKLRAGAVLDAADRRLLLDILEGSPAQPGSVGAERLARREEGWSITHIARAAGASTEAVKQSIRRERRRREAQSND